MREEHRRGMRGEGWGPPSRPGEPEWGPRPGRGGGRYGGERGEGDFRGGPGWGGPGGPGRHGGPGVRRRFRAEGPGGPFPPFGPGGPAGPGGPFGAFGPFGPEFGRHGFGRGPRARKGDVRAAILDLFAEDDGRTWNGYQLIQEIPARTDGAWRPSAGSVYPALQQLEDEGLIAPQGTGRRRVFTLTDAGRTYVEAHADELRASWDTAAGWTDDDAVEFRNLIRQVLLATQEVRRAGTAEQIAQARSVLAQARKSLYLILAQDESASAATADTATDTETPDAPEGSE
ncbi:MAG TPA: PadR family transcriptional regulator [Trebonia sp.]|nr:PadR family transcriptional regulator [Trebonia sp.]